MHSQVFNEDCLAGMKQYKDKAFDLAIVDPVYGGVTLGGYMTNSQYEWLLKEYAKPGDKILDTHVGSGSSRIAAYNLGFDYTGFEIDKNYFKAQEDRFKNHTAQLRLF